MLCNPFIASCSSLPVYAVLLNNFALPLTSLCHTLFKANIYLIWKAEYRVGERQKKIFHWCFISRSSMVRPGWKQKIGTPSRSLLWMAGAHAPGLTFAAFSGMLAWSWMGTGDASTWASALIWTSGMASGSLMCWTTMLATHYSGFFFFFKSL